MAGNDVILWSVPSDSDQDDVRLRDPSSTSGGGTSYTLTGLAGSYSISGGTTVLKVARILTANAGTYTYAGGTAVLKTGRVLNSNAGVYSLTGGSATLKVGRSLTANPSTYSISGGTASLSVGRNLSVNAGSYLLSGGSAVLTKSGSGIAYALTADPGVYLISGSSASMVVFTPSFGWVDRHDPGPKKKKEEKKTKKVRQSIQEVISAIEQKAIRDAVLFDEIETKQLEYEQLSEDDDEEAILMIL